MFLDTFQKKNFKILFVTISSTIHLVNQKIIFLRKNFLWLMHFVFPTFFCKEKFDQLDEISSGQVLKFYPKHSISEQNFEILTNLLIYLNTLSLILNMQDKLLIKMTVKLHRLKNSCFLIFFSLSRR